MGREISGRPWTPTINELFIKLAEGRARPLFKRFQRDLILLISH